eukprot:4612860-Pleurochrysis_carterae.AAC.2
MRAKRARVRVQNARVRERRRHEPEQSIGRRRGECLDACSLAVSYFRGLKKEAGQSDSKSPKSPPT